MFNNSDKFDHLIGLAAVKCTEEEARALNDLDTDNVSFDASYYRKRNKAINKYKQRAFVGITKAAAIRVAAVLMIMITLTCVLIGCVPELRRAIYDAIVEWYNEYFTVRYEDPDGKEKEAGHSEESTTETEISADAPEYIVEIRKPTDLPEGVWEDAVVQNNTSMTFDYYIGDEYLFSFTQMILKPNDNYFDNEDVNVMLIKINGNDATAVEHVGKKDIDIFWNDNAYSYHIFSTECDLETLLEYAKSVK